jgi:hypothetical protein
VNERVAELVDWTDVGLVDFNGVLFSAIAEIDEAVLELSGWVEDASACSALLMLLLFTETSLKPEWIIPIVWKYAPRRCSVNSLLWRNRRSYFKHSWGRLLRCLDLMWYLSAIGRLTFIQYGHLCFSCMGLIKVLSCVLSCGSCLHVLVWWFISSGGLWAPFWHVRSCSSQCSSFSHLLQTTGSLCWPILSVRMGLVTSSVIIKFKCDWKCFSLR